MNQYSDEDMDFLVRYFIGDYLYKRHRFNCRSDLDVFKLILGSVCFDHLKELTQ